MRFGAVVNVLLPSRAAEGVGLEDNEDGARDDLMMREEVEEDELESRLEAVDRRSSRRLVLRSAVDIFICMYGCFAILLNSFIKVNCRPHNNLLETISQSVRMVERTSTALRES